MGGQPPPIPGGRAREVVGAPNQEPAGLVREPAQAVLGRVAQRVLVLLQELEAARLLLGGRGPAAGGAPAVPLPAGPEGVGSGAGVVGPLSWRARRGG